MMGWSSWNHFQTHITDAIVRAEANAMVDSGLRDAGYVYVMIDDGWQGERDAEGELHPNSNFPDMAELGRYLHARGLKFGLYSSPGARTCAGFPGSLNHEEQDAQTFAAWGVDILKYDMCSYADVLKDQGRGDLLLEQKLLMAAFSKMHRALLATGHPIGLTLSNHGLLNISQWAPAAGAISWRTTEDVQDNYSRMSSIGFSQAGLARYAGPGHAIDPDMLEVGNGGMTTSEYRTQMSLWAILAAPLIAGNDLRTMDRATRELLTNPEVLAIDQDSLSRGGDRLWTRGQLEIWRRPLADGSSVLAVFNRATAYRGLTATMLHIPWGDLGLKRPNRLIDVWSGKETLGSPHLTLQITAHDVVLLRLYPTRYALAKRPSRLH
ncbi:MAG: glycoside hydrolase family 27 protein [Acidobacteria bacterium]|nr:glycoside hydrolase family 27 protein [Acidobacteriota bacterium]